LAELLRKAAAAAPPLPEMAPMALALLAAASLPALAAGRLGDTRPPLCAEALVRETCALLDLAAGDAVTPSVVQELFSATEASVEAFWRAAGLSAAASCADLCGNTTALLKSLGRHLPRTSDTGCYASGGDVSCDLDLAPEAIQAMAASSSDFPFSEGKSHQHHNEGIDRDAPVPAFAYSVEEVAVRVAQLFRIYPALDSDVDIAADGPRAESTPEQKALLSRRLRQAQAYLNIALRTFPANKTRDEATLFFGRPALLQRDARQRIQMVMNSVNNALSNATFVYLGPRCTARSFAYVYPCRGGDFHERDPRGRLYVHLCDMFFRVPSEQICTLVHEASHHTMACTDDAQYGARGCQRLARTKPADSLRNADSYGYYIREVARTFGTV